jgi:mannose-6-phosphate isomerase-like protein (cupin superfamily)
MRTALKLMIAPLVLSLASLALAQSDEKILTPLNDKVPGKTSGVAEPGTKQPASNRDTLTPGTAKMTNQTAKPAAVTFFEKDKVDAGFAKGVVLFDGSEKYQVHASRREKAGVVEIHEKDADIMYFISGTATLVTGGEPVNTSTISPGEIRATDIKGGETRKVRGGDVIVIPAGTPHWFKEVPGPLTYFTVKAR